MKWVKKIYHSINENYFYLSGMKPWRRGYAEFKIKNIKNALISNPFCESELPHGYGYRLDERIVEYPWFFWRLPEDLTGNILDAGSILNHDFLLKHKSLMKKNVFISTLAPEQNSFWRDKISYVYEDLRNSCFKDEYFDWIVSLSTIEHIGLDNTMLYTHDATKNENNASSYLAAIREYKRMLKVGGTLYLSFPFGIHKKHNWFQIFDGQMLDEIINEFAPSKVKEFHYKYDKNEWKNSSREESKTATYFDIHTQKDYDQDFAAASRAVVCLEMIK